MSEITPGQAAYEAYAMAAPDDLEFAEWDELPDWQQRAIDAAAQAGYEHHAGPQPAPSRAELETAMALALQDLIDEDATQQPQPAPELAAAMGEARQLRELVVDMLTAFTVTGSGHSARVGQVQIAKWRKRAGLEG
jgi:hypothetical protein